MRTAVDRTAEAAIPDAVVIALSVLPWRADPNVENTNERVNDLDQHLILVCNDGYSSSWAGVALADIGFTAISGVIGGFRARKADVLPTV